MNNGQTFGIILIIAGCFFWIGFSIGEQAGYDFGYNSNIKHNYSVGCSMLDNSIEKYSALEECGIFFSNGTYIEINCDVLEVNSE